MPNLELKRTRSAHYVDAIDISGAETDSKLIAMWLSGRPVNTVRAYLTDADQFCRHVVKPMRQVTAADLIGYAESLAELAASTGHSIERGGQILDTYNPRSFEMAKAAQAKRGNKMRAKV